MSEIRAGDHVHHQPTGEDWIVAYVDGDRLAWCGWPDGTVVLSDCILTKRCTDEAHEALLKDLLNIGGPRAAHAKSALDLRRIARGVDL